MKIKRLLLPAIIIAALPFVLYSQSNIVIDELLEQDKADWGRTSYLVLTAAELLDESTDITEVLAALDKQHWEINAKEHEDSISLGEYSFLLMKAFDMSGGLMYKIFPGPRYAARELYYLNLVDTDRSPGRAVSGEEVLRILGRLMEWKEERE